MTQEAFISKYVYFEIRDSFNIERLILTEMLDISPDRQTDEKYRCLEYKNIFNHFYNIFHWSVSAPEASLSLGLMTSILFSICDNDQ